MKKVLPVLLALMMLVSLCVVMPVTAGAEAEKATVTVEDIDGSSQTRAYHVGDEFTVISYLRVPSNQKVNSINLRQEFNIGGDVVRLLSDVDDEETFPNLKGPTANVVGNTISANQSKAKYKQSCIFDSDDAVLIKTAYRVIAAGSIRIKTSLITLAVINEDDTMQTVVSEGVKTSGVTLSTRTAVEAESVDPTDAPPVTSDKATITIEDISGATQTATYSVGDTFTVVSYLSVPAGKKVSSIDLSQEFNIGGTVLKLLSDVSDKSTFPNLKEPEANVEGNVIMANQSRGTYGGGLVFSSDDTVLINTKYRVIAAGSAQIRTKLVTLALISEGNTLETVVYEGAMQTGTGIRTNTVFNGTVTNPTTPDTPIDTKPTEVPVAPAKAIITVEDYNGTKQTAQFNVGDTFNVVSYLRVPAGKKVNSIDFRQEFNIGGNLVTLLSDVDDSTTFPNLKDPTVGVAGNVISVNQSKAKYKQACIFDSDDSVLINTSYKVIANGSCRIKTDIVTLAVINGDDTMEPVISYGKKKSDITLRTSTVFNGDVTPAEEPQDTSKSKLWIVADENWFPVQKGETVEYIYYLNTGEKVCSVDAETVYDADGLTLTSDTDDMSAVFPIIGSNMVFNDRAKGRLRYNYSSSKGKDFNTDNAQLIHLTFEVTADEGIYDINTYIHTLAGADEHIYVRIDDVYDTVKKSTGDLKDMTSDETAPATVRLLGDADKDRKITIFDASVIQKNIAGGATSVYEKRSADIDGDGYITIFDASAIQKYIAGSAASAVASIGKIM